MSNTRFAPAWLTHLAGDQTFCLFVCYGAGVAANIWGGQGATGASPFALGVAVVIGMLVRFGRPMTATDAGVLVTAHALVATLFGIDPAGWLLALAGDLAAIAVGSSMFLALRKTGRIASQPCLTAAACLTAAIASLAVAAVRLAAGGEGLSTPAALVGSLVSGALLIALGVLVILTCGRKTGGFAGREPAPAEGEAPFRTYEYFISGGLTAVLCLAAVADGRPTSIIAASLALLWFALRFGLFQTATAAFAFATALLAFGIEGVWPGLSSSGSAAADEFLRAVSVALLALPSVFIAAVVSDQRRLKMIYAYEATHDGLTRLANRTRYNEALDRAMKSAREASHRFVLMLIDLDHFKTVNDSHGHAVGDRLLIEVSNRLRHTVRASDLVARLGGDEFAIIAPVSTIADAMAMAKRLVVAVNQPCHFGDVRITPSITLGGVVCPDSGVDSETITVLADDALYEAKRAGRNAWRFSSGERLAAQDIVWVDSDPETGRQFAIDGDVVMLD